MRLFSEEFALMKVGEPTTIDVLNLPRFAAFCLFCDKFNNLTDEMQVGKSGQNKAF